MSAYDRLEAWTRLAGAGVGKVTLTGGLFRDNGPVVWEGYATYISMMTIEVNAGPRSTPEEVCVLLIERLAMAGVLVP